MTLLARLGILVSFAILSAPHISDFARAQEKYHQIFSTVIDEQGLGGLVFPQMREALPPLRGDGRICTTTVHEINIAGFPGVVVPAGYYDDGAPFCLIFVGRPWA